MSLAEIQKDLRVAKDKKSDFGGYSYRTAEGILAAVKPLLPEGAHINLTDSVSEVAGQVFLIAKATLTFADGTTNEAQSVALHPLTKKGMDPSQISGSASSYARKYALSGLFAIDDGEGDPDAAKTPYEKEPETLPQPVLEAIEGVETIEALQQVWTANKRWQADVKFQAAKDKRKAELTKEAA